MQDLIEIIRAAITPNATAVQKAAGVQACRTIAVALDTEPGQPLILTHAPVRASPLAGVSLDQVLDLVIARLSAVAKEHEETQARAITEPAASAPSAPSRAPTGLRVPMVPSAALNVARRAVARPPASALRPTVPRTSKS